MYKIRVPATSANMGPGFDAIGIALNLYNEIEALPSSQSLHFLWENPDDALSDKENLIYQSMLSVFQKHHFAIPSLAVHVKHCHIPIRRGLGSSSAAIVSGLTLAYAVMGMPFDRKRLSIEACILEGHPDNVVPAIEGGMSVTILKENHPPLSAMIPVPKQLRFIAVIPPYEISTEKSRAALPLMYQRSDCIANAARTALLIHAMTSENFTLLRTAFEDFIHQPYRLPLMEHGSYIFDLFQQNGAFGEFISGSGSTLIGVFDENTALSAMPQICESLQKLDPKFKTLLLEVDHTGISLT